jgi:hypothetical protein
VRRAVHPNLSAADARRRREVSVYNEMAKLGLGDTAEHNKEEHLQVKKLVNDADTTPAHADNYDDILARAVTAFDTHAKEEEQDQLPLLATKITPEQNDVRAAAPQARPRIRP